MAAVRSARRSCVVESPALRHPAELSSVEARRRRAGQGGRGRAATAEQDSGGGVRGQACSPGTP
eukprot:10558384-Alexandrium_andersonii.AAC.1